MAGMWPKPLRDEPVRCARSFAFAHTRGSRCIRATS